jgi:hypothetical protein
MMRILSSLVLLFSLNLWAQEFPAPGYKDQTENTMKELAKGLSPIEEKEIEGIQVKLYLAKSAKTAIEKQAFLVKDPDFSQQKLNDFIFKAFQSSLTYYRSIAPGNEIKELNLVIVDQGGDKGTISEVTQHSRVIQLHLVRWHKYLVKNTPHYVDVSSIHEFGHVINYMYSPKEAKLHREMSGVLLECLNFIQLNGIEAFNKVYLYYYTSKITDLAQILDLNYTNMSVIRSQAFFLLSSIYNGTYKGITNARELTEKLVISYITNPVDEAKGFDQAFEQVGLLDGQGSPLNYSALQKDTQRYICQTTDGCKL